MALTITITLLAILGFAVGMLVPAVNDRIRGGGRINRQLRDEAEELSAAVEDLWDNIDADGIDALLPSTRELAMKQHEKLWHR